MANRAARRRAASIRKKVRTRKAQPAPVLPEALEARGEERKAEQGRMQILSAQTEYAGQHLANLNAIKTLASDENGNLSDILELDEQEALEVGIRESKQRLIALHAALAEAVDNVINISFPPALEDDGEEADLVSIDGGAAGDPA